MLRELPVDYDLDHLYGALQYVTNFKVAIECGAHQGIWTKELLASFDRVHAFEPQPDNFLKLAGRSPFPNSCVAFNNLVAYNSAVGDKDRLRFLAPGNKNTGQYHIVDIGETPARMVKVDNYSFREVGFIKLDVEGYELFALKGAERTILESKPVILIEENGLCERYGVKSGAAGEYLESLGYELVDVFKQDYIYKET